MTSKSWSAPAHEVLRARSGFDLGALNSRSTPGWRGGKSAALVRLRNRMALMSALQERLFADGRTDGTRSVLLVLQGMDTAGKGGIVRHVIGAVDPQGVMLRTFGVPTPEELSHHYLWRVRRALPRPGYIGVFDRSHYEDVLIARVEGLVAPEVWESRYDEINAFEAKVVASGTTIVKVMLVVSAEEQAVRLKDRLTRRDKHWKYNPTDIDVRERWGSYAEAYQAVLDRTSTDVAPWYVVPADRKWYGRLAVSELLTRALKDLNLGWPAADFDPVAELARLKESRP